MATRIRLRRMGRKRTPSYRIVVADREAPRDGRFIETLGHYSPLSDPVTVEVNADRARHWIEHGATPTETVRSLLRKAGVFSPGVAEPVESQPAVGAAPPSEPAPAEAEPAE